MRFAVSLLPLAAATAAVGSVGTAAAAAEHALKEGEKVVFIAGTLKPGTAISCTSHRNRVVARVPRRGHSIVKIADGVAGGSATIRLTTRATGAVDASCR